MAVGADQKRAAFGELHRAGCFVMPNPWDIGSAIALESLGFKALATTSAGMAWSMGRADNEVGIEPVLAHIAALAAAVDIPLNADFENAFADDPEGVGRNVGRAAATGVAGLSVEDSTGNREAPLYDFSLAVERVAAARAAIDAAGGGVILTARSEGFIVGRPDMAETLRRLTAFAGAGADCLYAPGLRTPAQIAEVIAAVAPKPVNVLAPGLGVAALAALGARRVSVGGSLARTAWGEFLRAARRIAAEGDFGAFAGAASGAELNALFSGRR
ncbi:MAG TPA: isocitrate lyase/phosphoenolpyruvate mutase family protein [Caulobacteraceae bacterium]|nr:isocitrate lyase/phosphoenolpyruvate mutase family protein [Caulobacteraceae bacterium]